MSIEKCKNPELYIILRDKENPLHTKAINIGCGDRWGCPVCAKRYRDEQVIKILQIIDVLFERFGRWDFASGCVTIPKKRSLELDNKVGYNMVYRAFSRYLKIAYGPYVAVLASLQNWGDKNPSEPHIHIHYVVLPYDRNGERVKAYRPQKVMRKIWSMVCYEEGVTERKIDLDIHLQYLSHRLDRKLYFWRLKKRYLQYLFRRPIISPGVKSISQVIGRNAKFTNFKRIRRYGWLSGSVFRLVLWKFRIFIRDTRSVYDFVGFALQPVHDNDVWFFELISGKSPPVAVDARDIIDRSWPQKRYYIAHYIGP